MSYIKAETETQQKYFDFLEELRQSGDTNMFGASPYLQAAFGLSKEHASKTLSAWMKGHDDPSRLLKKPLSKTRTKVAFVTEAHVERSER